MSETPLHKAAKEGNTKKVRELMKGGFFTKGADVHAKDGDGRTALHLAAMRGHPETTKVLAAKGTAVHAKDGRTALHYAAEKGHKETAQALLANGADVHAKNEHENGWNALHLAAWNGHTEAVQVLVTKGADVNACTGNVMTALHLAAWNGHTEAVQVLVTNGAALHAKDKDGKTALHYAAYHTVLLTKVLLTKGANVDAKDSDGKTPLHYAAKYGYKETAQVLVSKGADVHVKDKDGKSPLDLAGSDAAMRQILTTQQQQQGQNQPLPTTSHGAIGSGFYYTQMLQSVEKQSSAATSTQMQSDPPIQQPQQGGSAPAAGGVGVPPLPPSSYPQPSPPVFGSADAPPPPPPPAAGPPPNNPATQPQRHLSDFSVDFNSKLGTGGSATVYKAFDNLTNKPVAVKVQPVGSLDAEAKLLTQLHHPNIVQVLFFDDGAESGASKLFLELVDGGSLDKLIESSGPLPEEEIRRYLSAILQALDCVHTQSPPVFHRDVKPANMLLAKDGTLKLTDFGCARVQGKTGTTATLIAGTWVCLAPEACVGKPCAASDLWATACSVVHMASGRSAWHETGLKDVTLAAHISKPNPPLNHYPIVPQTLSAPLQALLRKMFAHSPEHRGTAASHLKDPYFTNEIPSNPAPTAGGGSVAASAFPPWLLGLEVDDQIRTILVQNQIDERSFKFLGSDDIKEMGIALGPRVVLLNAIAEQKNA